MIAYIEPLKEAAKAVTKQFQSYTDGYDDWHKDLKDTVETLASTIAAVEGRTNA